MDGYVFVWFWCVPPGARTVSVAIDVHTSRGLVRTHSDRLGPIFEKSEHDAFRLCAELQGRLVETLAEVYGPRRLAADEEWTYAEV